MPSTIIASIISIILENNEENAVIDNNPTVKSSEDSVLLRITKTVIIHITKTRIKTPSTIPGLVRRSLFLFTIQFSLKKGIYKSFVDGKV